MAEIQLNVQKGRRKVAAPRIDLTPMVDLGFLLITFFMFTTTITKANTMELNMPSTEKTKEPTTFIAESTITIVASNNHQFYWYAGAPDDAVPMKQANLSGLRDVIISKKKEVHNLPLGFSAEAHKLHVLIKPTGYSTYDDVVNMLDEMQINAVPFYAITDVTPYEMQWIARVK